MEATITTRGKKRAAFLSIVSNTTLIILKFIAGYISGSISIISEAIHSLSDLLASFLAFFSVVKSSAPPDADHQFGHGKYEDFSGLIEGTLIILASFYIVFEAVKKILNPTEFALDTNIAIAVMLFAAVLNFFISMYIFRVAKKTDSIALFADAEHLRTDVYSSLAVFAGLLIIKITGIAILDPIIAIIVAVLILNAGFNICKKASNNLLDGTLPLEENKIIMDILEDYAISRNVHFKNVKTRKSGINREVELTLLVNAEKTIKEGHHYCDEIEKNIEEKLGNTSFLIHLEPFVENHCIK
ncbi:MAG: cation diffusion facilitator family transporter [Candidatus Gastranaerophilales bacterium]|nr:cation diffusion facilitator family transporter [Candidatus Gastranaerophilales bacterium]